ncbi:MAG: hypothetical protein GY714_12710, partial [Desulfobacterales bacterium]|nr:hypothetical protein [Desulfobacterales bacterium]
EFLKYWDMVTALVAIYSIGQLVGSIPGIFKNLRGKYTALRGKAIKNLDDAEVKSFEDSIESFLKKGDDAVEEAKGVKRTGTKGSKTQGKTRAKTNINAINKYGDYLKKRYKNVFAEFGKWDDKFKQEFLDDFGENYTLLNKLESEPELVVIWRTECRTSSISELKTSISRGGLREEYVGKVEELEQLKNNLLNQGLPKKDIAKTLFEKRRELTINYKGITPDDFLEFIYKRNEIKYVKKGIGDKWGLTWEGALKHYKKDYDKIMNGASDVMAPTKQKLGEAFKKVFKKNEGEYARLIKILKKYRMN